MAAPVVKKRNQPLNSGKGIRSEGPSKSWCHSTDSRFQSISAFSDVSCAAAPHVSDFQAGAAHSCSAAAGEDCKEVQTLELSDVSLPAGPALRQTSGTSDPGEPRTRIRSIPRALGVLWAEQEVPLPGFSNTSAQGWTVGAQAEGTPGHQRSGRAHTWHSWAPEPWHNGRTETKETEIITETFPH